MKSLEEITRKDLRIMYFTGRDTVSSAKVHQYRSGVKTAIGDFEEGDWIRYAEALVAREGGRSELDALIRKAKAFP